MYTFLGFDGSQYERFFLLAIDVFLESIVTNHSTTASLAAGK